MDLLGDMTIFIEVARTKSFSRAARSMRLPVSTVSRRIAELEARVGLQLLRRTTRQVELTDVGAVYLERCRSIVDAAEAAHSELKEHLDEAVGHLRISATPDFASVFLTPLFSDFARRFPKLTFEFDLSPRTVDLIAENIDVAIRMGPLEDSVLTVRTLGYARVRLFAAPRYLATAGTPNQPSDISKHECLRVLRGRETETTWKLHRGQEHQEVAVNGRFSANNIRVLLQLAVLGHGIAAIDASMGAQEVEAGTLTAILPDWTLPLVPVHALTPTRLLPAKTRLFLDCMAAHIAGLEPVPKARNRRLPPSG